MRRAWLLNLDAEHELELGRTYTPSRHVRALVEAKARLLIGTLVQPGDLVVAPGTRADGCEGVAWCPTPSARKQLLAAGATVAATPGLAVLRAVNARPFAAAVRAPLAGSSFEKHVAEDLERALSLLARPAALGWLVRRTFGAAGRGRRRIAAGRPRADELAWLRASLARGPLVLEPWVELAREHTRSGFVHPDGRVTVAAPCFQATTREGAWTGTVAAAPDELRRADDQRLEAAAYAAGEALAAAGYHGPFGIDAFHHRDGAREVLNPLSEINARYTMDWTTAMAARPEGA